MYNNATANLMLDTVISNYGDLTVGLSLTAPTLSGGTITNINEPTTGSYARASLPVSYWNAAANRSKVTNTDILFPTPTANWGLIGYIVLYDASTGTPVIGGPLTQTVNLLAGGDALRIPAGAISLNIP